MIKFKKVKMLIEEPTHFTCDRCDKEKVYSQEVEIVHISHTFGFCSSLFVDGFELSLDLCETCAWEMFSDINNRRVRGSEDED